LARPFRLTIPILVVLLACVVGPARADSIAVVVPTDGLRLRANPGTNERALDLIPGGTRIAINGPANADGWYPAVYHGQRGWVMGSFLAFDDLTAAAARKATVTSSDGLNLRTAPLPTADVITVLAAGATVTATGQATGDGWALVMANEQQGWASAEYLAFEGSSAPANVAMSAPAAATTAPVGMNSAAATKVTVRYYAASFEGSHMNCGGVYHADDASVAATNSWPCGTTLRVCNGAACVAVTVRDRGGMGANEIDVSPAAFSKLGSLSAGSIIGTAEVVTP
jgi:uncharacterized protein YgiM (DUF1202 family)